MHWLDRLFILPLLARKTKDENDEWLTSKKKHRFEVEERTGKIVKGFGGTLNGEKLGEKNTSKQPKASKADNANTTKEKLRSYFMGSPIEDVEATRVHINTEENAKKRQEQLARGERPKSYFTISQDKLRKEIAKKMKSGDFRVFNKTDTEIKAVFKFNKPIGRVYCRTQDGNISSKLTTELRTSYSKGKYHMYPAEEGMYDRVDE